jgi:hypothetical protein
MNILLPGIAGFTQGTQPVLSRTGRHRQRERNTLKYTNFAHRPALILLSGLMRQGDLTVRDLPHKLPFCAGVVGWR